MVQLDVMQFTGFNDKNGKEIYEGDIVQAFGNHSRIYWEFGSWQIEGGGLLSNLIKYVEVIGNIYENPNLVKK